RSPAETEAPWPCIACPAGLRPASRLRVRGAGRDPPPQPADFAQLCCCRRGKPRPCAALARAPGWSGHASCLVHGHTHEAPMFFQRIKTPGLAHNAYLLGDKQHAILVDPRRDIDEYLAIARANLVRIEYVVETHRQEDFVIGS